MENLYLLKISYAQIQSKRIQSGAMPYEKISTGKTPRNGYKRNVRKEPKAKMIGAFPSGKYLRVMCQIFIDSRPIPRLTGELLQRSSRLRR